MAADFLHGVETISIDTGVRPIRQVRTAVIGLVGTAPTYAASDPAALNEPTLILNERDAVNKFGPITAGFTIPSALNAIFDQGAGVVMVTNVFDTAAAGLKTTAQAISYTFTAASNSIQLQQVTGTAPSQTKVAGTKATGLSGTFTVTGTGGTPTHTLNTDYTFDANTGVLTRVAGGAITSTATVLVTYTYADPSKIVSSDVIGTVNGSGVRTGMQAWLDAYQSFGFFPKILIAPGFSPTNAIATELISLASRLRAIALIDAPVGTTYANAIAGRGPSGAINFNTSSDRAYLLYPYLSAYDSATDANTLQPYSQFMAGVMARTDNERGYWWSPSNKEILGVVGVERKLSAMINDAATEVNLLNEAGVTTLFNSFGTGIRTWGNRSAAWPSNTSPINFINIRRVADILHESIELSMLQFIDYPIDDGLIDAITESVNSFIRTLIARGALIDGECTYDPTDNPATEIALGHLTFNLTFMPPPPLERITFQSFIDINLLSQLTGTSGQLVAA